MRLELPIPTGWQHIDVDEGLLYRAPGELFGMLVTPIVPAQPDPERWVHRALMYRTLPTDGEPRDVTVKPFVTEAGWAGLQLDARVGSQARMVIYLAFLDYGATVVAMCREPEQIPHWRDEVLAILAKATPSFRDARPTCLADLLHGTPPQKTTDRRVRYPIVGWQRTASGGDLVLTHRQHPQAGSIRVSMGRSPILPVTLLFQIRDPGTIADEASAPRLDVTDEGEHVVFANARTATTQHTLAIVYGDHNYTQIEGIANDPAMYETIANTVTELAYSTTLGLGTGRWRRFYYTPPPGWTAIGRPRSTVWISPSAPKQHHFLTVFDARPPAEHERLLGARMFETLSQEFYREPPKGPAIYYTADDLECRVFVHTAILPNRPQPVRVLEGTIVTEPYVYPIRLEFAPDLLTSSTEIFERVVASFRPVPERRATTDSGEGALSYWAE